MTPVVRLLMMVMKVTAGIRETKESDDDDAGDNDEDSDNVVMVTVW